ncbi:MAG: hypothetical protein C0594_11790, partial [Marinilabiliales bacterium]
MRRLISFLLLFISTSGFLMAQTATIGSGTTSSSTYTPYRGLWEDGKFQFLYLASELSAAGMGAGDEITACAFNVATVSSSQPYSGFTIRMAQTSQSEYLASNFVTSGFSTVYPATSYSVSSTGWNTHTFSSNFTWDGTSNVIVEVCFDNSGYTSSDAVYYSTTTNDKMCYNVEDYASGCSLSADARYSYRPNIRFTYTDAGGPPSNDDCSGAFSLNVGASCSYTQYSTTGATDSGELPAPGCANYMGGDMWFTVTVPASGNITIDTESGDISDAGLAVYSGSCGSLSLIECDDDGGASTMSMIELTGQTPGATLYVRFWEYGNDIDGTFGICAYEPPPSNDDCSGATPLTVGSSCSFETFSNATAGDSGELPSPTCSSYLGGDVWFSFVVPASGEVYIEFETGDITDGGASVYSGSCGSLTEVECDDDDDPATAMPYFHLTGLTPSETLYIRFWEYGNNNNGTFGICVHDAYVAPPANDECSGAISLTSGTTCSYTSGDIAGATGSSPATVCVGTADNDVWYSFEATAAEQTVTVDPSTSMNAVVEVFSGTCGSLTSLQCSNVGSDNVTETNSLSGLSIGQTYYIRVYDYDATDPLTTDFDICVIETPTGANCDNPELISSVPYTNTGMSTCGFGDDFDNSQITCTSYYMGGDDFVFEYTPSADEVINVALTNTSTYTGVFVLDGCPDTSPNCVAYNENSSGNPSLSGASLTAGQTYYIVVSTWPSPQCTDFDIAITTAVPPANDDCDGAIDIISGTTCSYTSGTIMNASASSPATACSGTANNDVWYSFVATSSYQTIEVDPSTSMDAAIEVLS